MPSSASLTTASGALMSFFIVWCSTAIGKPFSAGVEEDERQRTQDAAGDRGTHEALPPDLRGPRGDPMARPCQRATKPAILRTVNGPGTGALTRGERAERSALADDRLRLGYLHRAAVGVRAAVTGGGALGALGLEEGHHPRHHVGARLALPGRDRVAEVHVDLDAGREEPPA